MENSSSIADRIKEFEIILDIYYRRINIDDQGLHKRCPYASTHKFGETQFNCQSFSLQLPNLNNRTTYSFI